MNSLPFHLSQTRVSAFFLITSHPKTDITAILDLVSPFWKLPSKVHTEIPWEKGERVTGVWGGRGLGTIHQFSLFGNTSLIMTIETPICAE